MSGSVWDTLPRGVSTPGINEEKRGERMRADPLRK